MGAMPEERRVHDRLMAKEPSAPAEAVELLLPRLVGALRWRAVSDAGDHEQAEAAAIEALLTYVQRPEMYDPEGAGLLSFLTMAAVGDYRNWLRKESRHGRGRVTLELVENTEASGKYKKMSATPPDIEEQIDLRDLADRCAEALQDELPSPVDRAILKLMLDGERSTRAYAEAMGLPVEDPENTATVKRAKDRISKKLHRMRGRVDAG